MNNPIRLGVRFSGVCLILLGLALIATNLKSVFSQANFVWADAISSNFDPAGAGLAILVAGLLMALLAKEMAWLLFEMVLCVLAVIVLFVAPAAAFTYFAVAPHLGGKDPTGVWKLVVMVWAVAYVAIFPAIGLSTWVSYHGTRSTPRLEWR